MTEITRYRTIFRRGARGYVRYPDDIVTVKADTEGGQVTIQIGKYTETMILRDRDDLATVAAVVQDLLTALDTDSQEG